VRRPKRRKRPQHPTAGPHPLPGATTRPLDITPHLQRDEWLISRRYRSEESIRALLTLRAGEQDKDLDLDQKEVSELIAG
jgi:hypothetical protein